MNKKTTVYLWTGDVIIKRMPCEDYPLDGSSLNASHVMSMMLPSNDVDAMIMSLVTSVRLSIELGENDKGLANRLYCTMMKESNEA
jgi:hypothetical protein